MIWAAEEYEDKNAWEDEKVHCVTIDITDAAGTTHAVSISYRAEKVVSPEGEYTDSYPEGMSKLFIAIEPQAYKGLESGTYDLEWMRIKYTGSTLKTTERKFDENTGKTIINEIRDDYYTRTHYEAQLTIAKSAPSASYRYYPTVTAVLNGPNKSATDYSGGIYGLIFRSGTYFGSFQGVQVDGKTIAAANYTAEDNGGTEVYLKAVYLRTLAAGQHTLTILSSAGDVTAEFTVSGGNSSPKTFDTGITVYAVTALLSLTGMAWVGKKKF